LKKIIVKFVCEKKNYFFEKIFYYYKIWGGGFSGLGLRLLCVSSMRNNNKGQCSLPGFFIFIFILFLASLSQIHPVFH